MKKYSPLYLACDELYRETDVLTKYLSKTTVIVVLSDCPMLVLYKAVCKAPKLHTVLVHSHPETTQIVEVLRRKVGERLQRITFRDMWVSSTDVGSLVWACQNLKVLSLRRCASVHACHAKWLVDLKHITQLDLSRTHVPQDVLSLLRQAHPFAQIKPAASHFKRNKGKEKEREEQETRGKKMYKYLEESEKKAVVQGMVDKSIEARKKLFNMAECEQCATLRASLST